MSERLRFMARFTGGERMTDLCEEFGISRKTGYKIVERYKKVGIEGLKDQSKAPRVHPNQTPLVIREALIRTRLEHPTWGAPMIKSYLEKKLPKSIIPARSTIHAILDRQNLIKARRRKNSNHKAQGTILSDPRSPNELWCTDFKGQFRLGNKSLCYPLTVSDQFSRFLLLCEGLESIDEKQCIESFHHLFSEYGLPESIRSDNGVPFATPSYFGLSKLSVFWLRLGIKLERITPGHPEQNGRHERMHRTLKTDAINPVSFNILSQQERFESFKQLYNCERPHQGLDMKRPADVYRSSKRTYNPYLEPLEYPHHDKVVRVTNCGSIIVDRKVRIYVGTPFSGYNLGIKEIDDQIWSVSFMDYEMGFFDLETRKINPVQNPFLRQRLS